MHNYLSNISRFSLILAGVMTMASLTNTFATEITKSPEVTETGKLSIANTLDYAPFEFIGEDGKPTGVNVDLAQAAADLLGAELDIVRIPFTSMIPGLAAGRFKISWETFSPTPERLEKVDFVIFIKAGIVGSVLKKNADSYAGENNLCGKKVGIIAGSVSDLTADEISNVCKAAGLPELEKSIFPEAKDVIQAALAERVDARLDDATASGYYEATSGGKLVVVDGIYNVSPLGLAVSKGDSATAVMMRDTLQALIDNGTYATIMKKYGLGSAMIEKSSIVDKVAE